MRRPGPWDWLFIILPAAAFILIFLGVALARITYPFELEWMEGGSWLQALRLAHSDPLYVKPSLEFTPFIYTPLYFWISSRLDVFGLLTLPAMRFISLFASLALIALLGRWVHRETRHSTAAMLTMGIYAASFSAGGYFFDLARADALWLLLLMGSAYVLHFHATLFGHFAAALLLVAALYTKQQALAVGVALCLSAWLRNRRLGLFFTGTFALLSASIFFLLESQSHGWFSYYTLTLPSHHAWDPAMFSAFWTQDIGFRYALPLLALLLTSIASRHHFTLAPLLLSLLLISWLSRLHTGGYLNVLMPIFAALALATGLIWPKFMENPVLMTVGRKRSLVVLASCLACLQWISWAYNPRFQLPTNLDLMGGIKLVERLKAEKGRPFIPNHPYLAYLSGKRPSGHRMALEDVLRVKSENSDFIHVEMMEAITSNSFCSIYLNSSNFSEEAILPKGFLQHYHIKDSVFKNEGVFRPRTGMKLRPQYHFEPVSR